MIACKSLLVCQIINLYNAGKAQDWLKAVYQLRKIGYCTDSEFTGLTKSVMRERLHRFIMKTFKEGSNFVMKLFSFWSC